MTEKELEEAKYQYFGYANDWKQKPQEITACANQGHLLNRIAHGFSRTQSTVCCHVCKLYYKYDSSG